MTADALRCWSVLHTWSSLVCTVFLLMLCATGLPLIFHAEIEAALNPQGRAPAPPAGASQSLDALLARALAAHPGAVPLYMSFDEDRPVVNVTTGPRPDAPATAMHFASYDRSSGAVVPPPARGAAFMEFLRRLHTDLFLGLPGMLFLGVMGLVFVLAIVSGVVLYHPFTRHVPFGTLRTRHSTRVQWLDTHNLLGILTVAWALVVGVSGAVNTLADPLAHWWKRAELADLDAHERGPERVLAPGSLAAAVAAAQAAAPTLVLQFVAFPGTPYSTARHYAIFLHGTTPLTAHLVTPVFVDATSGVLDGIRPMPWYLQALAFARPLHFGDFGGLPLKGLWALLTTFTQVVLVSGIWLWFVRRRVKA